MILEPIVQWIAFIILSIISIGGALGMATTMSMFRSGIFLMASFIGVAGLFILLSADLMALLQVMMYIGGMLIMILYMLLFSNDPGGAMMADMDMSFFENFFSRGLKPDSNRKDVGEEEMEMDMGGMSHAGMSMTTAIKPIAAVVALIVGILLMMGLLLRPVWILSGLDPATDSGRQVGNLLMSKYMMGFEGAGLLILIGIFGAVFVCPWPSR
jgi:NADH-quinone oxidoreductase subunit J